MRPNPFWRFLPSFMQKGLHEHLQGVSPKVPGAFPNVPGASPNDPYEMTGKLAEILWDSGQEPTDEQRKQIGEIYQVYQKAKPGKATTLEQWKQIMQISKDGRKLTAEQLNEIRQVLGLPPEPIP